jgi:UDP-glucose 4-epimerase
LLKEIRLGGANSNRELIVRLRGAKRMAQKVVLVTGVADYWGARLAARLMAEPGFHVIGLDVSPPKIKGLDFAQGKGLDFVQADVRNPLLVELFRSENVHAVCHLKFVHSIRPSEAAFDVNVMGTMKVFGACAEAGVKKVVLKSNMAVYGARPYNSSFLPETHSLYGSRRYGYIKDMVSIESFCNGFIRQAPGMRLTILRFASIVGPTAKTPMTDFLSNRWAPALTGFDPMMQVIHEDDVVEALAHVTVNDAPGVFNVAAEDTLPLRRLMGLSGKFPISILHPLAYAGIGILGSGGLRLDRHLPIEPDYLRYPWTGDLSKMRQDLGFTPHYTAKEALREFAARRRTHRYLPDKAALTDDEERLNATIQRRRRARARSKKEKDGYE